MATTNANSRQYIADANNANKVYFDIELPRLPYPKPKRSGADEEAYVPGSSAAGEVATIDMGASTSSRTLDIEVPYAEFSTVDAIDDLYKVRAQVTFSPDDGTTKYLCTWRSGESFFPEPVDGLNVYTMKLRLRVNSIT